MHCSEHSLQPIGTVVQLQPKRVTGSALACSSFGGRQDGYDQSDLPDVIILLKVIVSLFC